MTLLNWPQDPATAIAAQRHPLPLRATVPAAQFGGFRFDPTAAKWACRALPSAHWPAGRLVSSPQQILHLFAAGHRLEALAMVVSWGGMGRTINKSIYAGRSLHAIDAALQKSAALIQQSSSISDAWGILTGRGPGGLGWSPIFTSKTLHFLCRALGFEQNPPVPIDGGVILKVVWPAWRRLLPPNLAPLSWRGPTVASYLRYMTAILVWAGARAWTTTQMELTIFEEYRPYRVYEAIVKAVRSGALPEPFSSDAFRSACPGLRAGTYNAFLDRHSRGNAGRNAELFDRVAPGRFTCLRPFAYGL